MEAEDQTSRLFTVEEAGRTLPLVRKIVQDILLSGKELKLLAEEITESEFYNNAAVRHHKNIIESCMKELDEIGCFYKDWNFTVGLIDFPSVVDGKPVLLCWRSDETEILYYHDYESGYAGRKLLTAAEVHN